MERADRIKSVPPYLFARINKKKSEYIARGVDVISFTNGDPDQPTPQHIIDKMCEEVRNPKNHRYPGHDGLKEFKQAVAHWYKNKYDVDLNPSNEILPLIGSKEGVHHIFWGYVNPGDIALLPDPYYPVYNLGTVFTQGVAHYMPLRKENNFLPNFNDIDTGIAKKAKIMFLGYPNNPTTGVANIEFFEEAIAFCKEFDIVLCHDFAYSELVFDGYKAPSILQVKGAKDIAIEFNSLSKPFNMTGWRLGYACGSKEIIEVLSIVKSNIDAGQFNAIQHAGVEALLNTPESFSKQMTDLYQRRRDVLIDGLNSLGWNLEKPKGTFYVWAPVPDGYTSESFAEVMLEKCGIICVPGNSYGNEGNGYVRFVLTVSEERIKEAIERMRTNLFND